VRAVVIDASRGRFDTCRGVYEGAALSETQTTSHGTGAAPPNSLTKDSPGLAAVYEKSSDPQFNHGKLHACADLVFATAREADRQ
jgi:hypothetical protein